VTHPRKAEVAQPRSINLPGSRARTQQYELAPGLAQYVQAVYVEVDNTTGSSTRPLLTLSEQSGVVIAKKRQDAPIPAGTSDSATWALRLEADLSGVIRMDQENDGQWLSILATQNSNLPGPTGRGITIESHDDNPSSGGFVTLDGTGVFGRIELNADNTIFMNALSFAWEFDSSGIFECDGLTLNTGSYMQARMSELVFDVRGNTSIGNGPFGGSTFIQLGSGEALVVLDSAGDPIFKVNEDGSLQGKTGKALTFNL